ncbi:hypothetical protein TYRP_001413 [Tyrophagus putrescentiae]|nr:hypothetical protein TYRP_001413 [Tyrophagus putrescentiae]
MLHIQEHVRSLPMATENQSFEDTERAVNRLRSVPCPHLLFTCQLWTLFFNDYEPKESTIQTVQLLQIANSSMVTTIGTITVTLPESSSMVPPIGTIAEILIENHTGAISENTAVTTHRSLPDWHMDLP